jgi:hypothetical protein
LFNSPDASIHLLPSKIKKGSCLKLAAMPWKSTGESCSIARPQNDINGAGRLTEKAIDPSSA